jgi:hypothetical protein
LAFREGLDDEAQAVYRRADYRGFKGARAADEDGGHLPLAGDQSRPPAANDHRQKSQDRT